MSTRTPSWRRTSTPTFLQLLAQVHWPTRVIGIIASVVSMHMLIVRPLVSRIHSLEAEVQHFDTRFMSAMEQTRSESEEVAALLGQLKSQHEDLAAARASVHQLIRLQREIGVEAERAEHAIKAVERIRELPERILETESVLIASLPRDRAPIATAESHHNPFLGTMPMSTTLPVASQPKLIEQLPSPQVGFEEQNWTVQLHPLESVTTVPSAYMEPHHPEGGPKLPEIYALHR